MSKQELKLEVKIVEHVDVITVKTEEINAVLEEYIDIANEPEDQMIASSLLIQMEKIKSSISRILDTFDRD